MQKDEVSWRFSLSRSKEILTEKGRLSARRNSQKFLSGHEGISHCPSVAKKTISSYRGVIGTQRGGKSWKQSSGEVFTAMRGRKLRLSKKERRISRRGGEDPA